MTAISVQLNVAKLKSVITSFFTKYTYVISLYLLKHKMVRDGNIYSKYKPLKKMLASA